jgi:hypothetical protein
MIYHFYGIMRGRPLNPVTCTGDKVTGLAAELGTTDGGVRISLRHVDDIHQFKIGEKG